MTGKAFTSFSSPTPYKLFDDQVEFQSEADSFSDFLLLNFGSEVLSIELGKKTIWANLEHSVLEFSSLVNSYHAKSTLKDLLGLPTGSILSGSENRRPVPNGEWFHQQAEVYSDMIGQGTYQNSITASITLEKSRQDYNLLTELLDGNNNPAFNSLYTTGSRGRMRILEVFHFDPDVSFLALTASPAINYLSAEFNFESFSRGTHFFSIPVAQDILQMGLYKIAHKVRRSNFSYQLLGTKIRIFPAPTKDDPKKLWIRVATVPQPLSPPFNDDTTYGVSNLSNLPFGEIKYSNINSIGKQFIRKFALALCKETLGHIRSKFKTINLPGSSMEMDGSELIAQAREDKEKLREELKELLESLTYQNLMKMEADRAQSLHDILKYAAPPKPILIF